MTEARYSVDAEHRLLSYGQRVRFRASPNKGGAMLVRRFLVMHYTAGPAPGCEDWMCDPVSRVSAHVLIRRMGEVVQLVPFNVQAWHAGASRWGGFTGLNHCAIGIELENWGELDWKQGQAYARNATGRLIEAADVVTAPHKSGGPVRRWHRYTAEQLETAKGVGRALVARYNLDEVLGHDDIAPGRKVDPGPAWPMEEFRRELGFGAEAETLKR